MADEGAILVRTATAAGWTVGWRMFTRVVGLCSTLILARLLTPADFGLVALATGFASSLDELSQVGVDDALMRIKAPPRALYDTAFTIDMLRGVATAALLLAVARPVAEFFNDPRLADVLRAVAAGTAIVGCHNVGAVDFRRDMQFQKEFKLYVLPRLAQVAVTLALAAAFRSYWALVAGILTGRIGVVLYSYVLHPFRARPSLSAWRELAGFSAWSWVLSLVALARDRTDAFFVGRALDTRAVGVFSVGVEIGSLPTTELVSPLAAAAFAGFAAARHEGAGAGETYLRVVGAVAAVTVPAGLGISLLADPLVRLALGPGWLQAIPVIEVAGAVGGGAAFGLISAKLFSAHAYFGPLFGVSLASMLLRIGLLTVLVPRYGVTGAAVAGGVGVSLEHAAFVALACRRFGLRGRRIFAATWRTALAACVMAGALAASGLGWAPHPGSPAAQAARLAGGAVAGAAVYACALAGLWLASGRPRGPETDFMAFAAGLVRRLARRTPDEAGD